MTTTLVAPCPDRARSDSPSAAVSAVLQRWRRQIASRSDLAERRGPRPFALIGYRVSGSTSDTLVPIERLSFVALFDERDEEDRLATRFLAARVSGNAAGLRVGGVDQTLFDKNIRLAPASQCGSRLDPRDAELCELAFGWEQYLERVDRHPHYPRRNVIRWPRWFAEVIGSAAHGTTELVPWDTAVAQGLAVLKIWADVGRLPKRQIIAGDPRRTLRGADGPVTFDLFHSRFRRGD